MAIRDRAPSERIYMFGSICGRCGGTGIVPFYNEATQSTDETHCGICGGTGQGPSRLDTSVSEAYGITHGVNVRNYSPPTPGSRHFADGISAVRSTGRGGKGKR